MIRLIAFFALLTIDASTPLAALASQCDLSREIAASRARWAATRQQLLNTTNQEASCRAFAAAFVQSVMARQAAATCAREAGREADINALDSEIDALNDLLAVRCRG